jgi:uncharacterized protein (DUF58 family)
MLTTRGSRFLIFVIALLALSMVGPLVLDRFFVRLGVHLPNVAIVTLIALTLLLWFAWEWLQFMVRARLVLPRLRIERTLHDDRGTVETLWAGMTFSVRIRVFSRSPIRIPFLTFAERVPFNGVLVGGDCSFNGAVSSEVPAEFEYRLRTPGIGRTRFEGLSAKMADLQGFFFCKMFLSSAREYRVLPALLDPGEHGGAVKRRNLLMPPGIHRHRRPGAGSELLDLRDYRVGDPPKTIAWKISARRDRLITKEFESEVPVRCTLFVDTSRSVRLEAPGQNALSRLVDIAAAVARAASDNRDLTSLCGFDESGCRITPSGRGSRHLIRLLNSLADMAGQPAATAETSANALLPTAFGFAADVYPELMRPDINRYPAWLGWIWPPPAYTKRRPRLADRLYAWLPFVLPIYAFVALTAITVATFALLWSLVEADAPAGAIVGVLIAALVIAVLLLTRIPLLLFFPKSRRLLRWRKQLSAVLSVKYGLAPGGLGTLLEDDERFGAYLQRFLANHHVPFSAPLYDTRGKYMFAAPDKVAVLASALLRSVGKSHDNELYVLLVDLLELTDELAPLLRAVKVALARHHRVVLVCPWPPGIPPPTLGSTGQRDKAITTEDMVRAAMVRRFHRGYARVRRQFVRLGIPVINARSGDPARLILDRLEMLREVRTIR